MNVTHSFDTERLPTTWTVLFAFGGPATYAVQVVVMRALTFDWRAVVSGVFAVWTGRFEWKQTDYALGVRHVPGPGSHT